jgi:hypothetical protein
MVSFGLPFSPASWVAGGGVTEGLGEIQCLSRSSSQFTVKQQTIISLVWLPVPIFALKLSIIEAG